MLRSDTNREMSSFYHSGDFKFYACLYNKKYITVTLYKSLYINRVKDNAFKPRVFFI